MKLHATRAPALALLALAALLVSGCVVLKVSDVRDLAHGLSLESHVSCAAEDGSAYCRCEERCVVEPSDCHCDD
jgi:hypothetical protein